MNTHLAVQIKTLLNRFAEWKQCQFHQLEVLDSEWNANNGDAEEQSPSEMCERNSKTSYKPPYHIH